MLWLLYQWATDIASLKGTHLKNLSCFMTAINNLGTDIVEDDFIVSCNNSSATADCQVQHFSFPQMLEPDNASPLNPRQFPILIRCQKWIILLLFYLLIYLIFHLFSRQRWLNISGLISKEYLEVFYQMSQPCAFWLPGERKLSLQNLVFFTASEGEIKQHGV